MSEGIAASVGRIISGSVNAVIDAVENAAPETVMEQAIREVDSATDEVRTELGRVLANRHLANRRLMEENRKHEELSANIQLAVNEGRDDLAEAAVARQIDIEAQIPVLENAIAESVEKEHELEGYVQALQAKKREMAEELRQFRDSRAETSLPTGSAAATSGSISNKVEKANAAFDRILASNANLPGRSTADMADAAKMAELEALSRKNRIQERLAAIKAENKN